MSDIFELLSQNFIVAAKVSLPFLIILLLAGLLIGLVQAATQVNEPATPFIVKLFSIGVLVWILGSWSVHAFSNSFANNLKHIGIYKTVSSKNTSGTPPSSPVQKNNTPNSKP